MKAVRVLLVSGITILLSACSGFAVVPRADDWAKVAAAAKDDQPKTVVELLKPIETAAFADRAWAEGAKALAMRIITEAAIERDETAPLKQLAAAIPTAPAEARPILRLIEAELMFAYYQENWGSLGGRSATAGAVNADIATWDLPRLLAETAQRLHAVLADPAALQTIPVSDFGAILDKGDLGDSFRPTLYDFIAHEALLFYTSAVLTVSRPADEFEINATSPALADSAAFLAWQPAGDATSLKLRALRLYQDLLNFHRTDADRSAFLHSDLERLRWAADCVVGETKEQRIDAAFRAFIAANAKHPLSSDARLEVAHALRIANKPREAHDLAKTGADAFPDHPFGKLCLALANEIEEPILNAKAMRSWSPAGAKIYLQHTNLQHVWLRLYQRPWQADKATLDGDPVPEDDEELSALISKAPNRAWDAALPDERDFRTRVSTLTAPHDLPPGYYVLVISTRPDFSLKENHLATLGIHVGTRALVLRSAYNTLDRTGLVTDAVTGAPLAGVAVAQWQERTLLPGLGAQRTRTDADGAFALRGLEDESLVVAGSGADLAIARPYGGFSSSNVTRKTKEPNVLFFTDRALYRPGQPIHVKGIVCQTDPAKGIYQTLGGHSLKVTFSDPNKKQVAEIAVVSNASGSFEGTFTAPTGSLLGRCEIAAGKMGSTDVTVEEYKRPKFFVEIKPPAVPAALGGKVTIAGRAETYTGAAADGAKVTWRVRRTTALAEWFRMVEPNSSTEVRVTAASKVTAADGSFEVTFTAEPDRSVDQAKEPAFCFEITAEVTDPTGETRTAETVITVAYTAFQAELSAATWQEEGKPAKIKVDTATHDGKALAAAGMLRIHRVQEPDACPPDFEPLPFGEANEKLQRPADPTLWPLGEVVKELPATTVLSADGGQAVVEIATDLPAGLYRAVFETEDANHRKVRAYQNLQVLKPADPVFHSRIPFYTASPTEKVEPGKAFTILWGSGLTEARACVEWLRDGKLLKREWSAPGRTQQVFSLTPDESFRGGFTVRVTQTTLNRLQEAETEVEVPWTNKELALRWEHLTSKLEPGAKDVWTAVVTGPDGQPAAAEMVATVYDASLDAFESHGFPGFSSLFRSETSSSDTTFHNSLEDLDRVATRFSDNAFELETPFRSFAPEISDDLGNHSGDYGDSILRRVILRTPEGRRFATTPLFGSGGSGGMGRFNCDFVNPMNGYSMAGLPAKPEFSNIATAGLRSGDAAINRSSIDAILNNPFRANGNYIEPSDAKPSAPVATRKNLQETAFFFPQLLSNENGEVRMAFTMPEALTTWRFLGFAHDAAMRSGSLYGETVTAKDLMVQPNPPRFLREGDVLDFTVKITNRGEQPLTGTARFSLADAATAKDLTAALGVTAPELPWTLTAKESRTLSWRLTVPTGTGFLTYKATATSGNLSDGEEGWLPIIPRRVLLIESMDLPSRTVGTKDFTFQKLVDSGKSATLESRLLQVQVVSRPAWYAVMALPYLMESPNECAEQTFNRYYANALARHLAKSDPKLRRIFDLWKNTPALDSPLARNSELAGLVLDETPWLAEAADQAQARRNAGLLFDDNRLDAELERNLEKVTAMQREDGLWPWFPGGHGNAHISLCIATGFARLRALGVATDIAPALKVLPVLDAELTARLATIKRDAKNHPATLKANHFNAATAEWLYTRTLFLKDRSVKRGDREAFDYFVSQAGQYWTSLDSRLSRAHAALALNRLGDQATARLITRSLREHALRDPETGMSWRDSEDSNGWYWWQAPIEAQAMMIEAFREIDHDDKAVEDCQDWLIQQKQVRDWGSTMATADAIHALLSGSRDLLGGDATVQVSLGGTAVKPEGVEPGTGFYEARFAGPAIRPELGHIQLTQSAPGATRASVHWQYLEDPAKITAHDTPGLKLEKAMFVRKSGPQGPVLEPVTGPLKVGDELVTRLILRNDRAMEFVQLKDSRGSGSEPINVLSGYRWQDGFGYYEVTRDTASHFFIDVLPAGTHVFETGVRLQHAGVYQSGAAEIRCLYAPAFNAHSGSTRLEVGP